MIDNLTYGSVCSGIEAATAAWHVLGWRPAWFAEIEDFPSRVLAHHYPNVPNLGDMTQIAAAVRAGAVAAPDVLVGGTPCQAFSVAGLRESLDDARGQLTLAYVELADAIDDTRTAAGEPECIIVWENVPGVLNTKDNAFGCFLGALAGEDCALEPPGGKWPNAGCVSGPKRTIAWRVLDAQFFGVAQRRRRVFVVASAREGFDPAEVLFEFDGVRRDSAPSREAGQETAGTLASRTDGGGFPGTDEACSGYVQPVGGFQRPGVDLRNGALTGEVAHTVQAGAHAPDPGGTSHVFAPITYPIQNALRGKDQNGLGIGEDGAPMYTLDQGSQHGVAAYGISNQPTPKFAEELSPSLDAKTSGGGRMEAVFTGMAVRRLTPRECERLQAFPDDHTLIPVKGKPAADGPRYKALGNSMCVNNMRWIGQRIHNHLTRPYGDLL